MSAAGKSETGRVKLVHIITRLDRGGSSEVVLDLAAQIDPKRFDVQIITGQTLEPTCDLAEYTRRTGIPITVYPKLRREVIPVYDALVCLYLIVHLIRIGPDIVHTHSSKAGILGRIAALIAGIPIIIHAPHGHVFYGYFGPFTTRLFVWIERLVALITDRIITLTDLGKWDHVAFGVGPPEQFLPIPCGIDLSRFRNGAADGQALRETLGLRPDEPLVLWAGRLTPIKGCEYFLEACDRVVRQYGTVPIYLVGDGPLAETLKAQAEALKLKDTVHFMGQRSDMPAWMWAADLFVLSSLNEGLGRVLLEAMAGKTPIVATNVGGVASIIESGVTGLLVPAADSDQLADAMLTLLGNRALAHQLGEAGFLHAGTFDMGKMTDKTIRLYETLLREKGNRWAA